MESVQKFSTFDDLKNSDGTAGQPLSEGLRHFIDLIREGEISVRQDEFES